uniref:Magnesium transporter n=1 Tax=Solanum lycopersicum TaxID=4081 RepID=A0A3Q7EQ23_SOLLC
MVLKANTHLVANHIYHDVICCISSREKLMKICMHLQSVSLTPSIIFPTPKTSQQPNMKSLPFQFPHPIMWIYLHFLSTSMDHPINVREYIDDTEDYVNIQLDNQRNELIQLQLTLTIASFAVAVETLIAGWFGMNIPCTLYHTEGLFWPFVLCMTIGCIMLFLVILGYARWKKLLGS